MCRLEDGHGEVHGRETRLDVAQVTDEPLGPTRKRRGRFVASNAVSMKKQVEALLNPVGSPAHGKVNSYLIIFLVPGLRALILSIYEEVIM